MVDTGSEVETRLSALVDRALSDFFESGKMTEENVGNEAGQLRWSSIDDFVANNKCGKGGTRQKKFRRTKKQMVAGLSRQESFDEFNLAYTAKYGSVEASETNS